MLCSLNVVTKKIALLNHLLSEMGLLTLKHCCV